MTLRQIDTPSKNSGLFLRRDADLAEPLGPVELAEILKLEELAQAGVLLDGNGLQPTAKGWRIRYAGDKRTVVDGPFTEAKELVAGYTLIQVKSREEALEWSRRFPNPMGKGNKAEVEVRELYEDEDFA